MLRLRYFGPFAALLDGAPVAFPTRPSARLLALLGLEPGKVHRRDALAALVWPESEGGRDVASLRTALWMLRETIGREAIVADRDSIRLLPEQVESDWADAKRLLRRADLDPDAETRERVLAELVAFGDEPVLEGWESEWIPPLRAERRRASARAALELAGIRLASGDYRRARELAVRSIRLRPRSEAPVSIAMRAAAGQGEPAEARAFFERHLARVETVSPGLAALAAEIARERSATVAAPRTDALAQIFETGLREDPEATVRFLLRDGMFWWRHRDLRRGQEILSLALESEIPPALLASGLTMLGSLYYRTSDYRLALDNFERARAASPALSETLRNTLDGMEAVVDIDLRRWDEAQALNAAILARLAPDDRYRWKVENNVYGIEAHLMRTDAAREGFHGILARLVGEDDDTAYGIAVTHANLATAEAGPGNWEAAERHAQEAKARFTARIDPLFASGPIALHALARAAQGDKSGLPELVTTPLDPVRGGARRWAQVVFDIVAEGLAHGGYGDAARAILRANAELRASIGHVRSPAEKASAARAEAVAQKSPGPPFSDPPQGTDDDHAALAAWVAGLIEPPN